jgi:hypothetical protein
MTKDTAEAVVATLEAIIDTLHEQQADVEARPH